MSLAKALVRDGEGASKFVEIHVAGAPSNADAKAIAASIAKSQLCKTAFAGSDPNWGPESVARPVMPAWPSMPTRCVFGWMVSKSCITVCRRTMKRGDAAVRMQQKEFVVRVSVGEGPGTCTFWTSDLTHDYVTINADYRT